MAFKTERYKNYAIMTISEERLDSHTTPQLNSELVILSGHHVENLIIDFDGCDYCDAAGLSCIMIAHRLCKNGKLIICNVTPSIERMLSIQRFDPELSIVSDRQEAISRMSE
ncbi:MAG: STAS domain-containing protein [Bacteroidales bacterium]|nr:STAS domain-containing protein [Bacteroidales bacterium]